MPSDPQSCLRPRREPELGEDARNVGARRSLADAELARDRLVRVALAEQTENVCLPWRQGGVFAHGLDRAHEPSAHGAVDLHVSVPCRAHGSGDPVDVRVLEQIPGGPRLQRGTDPLGLAERGQDDDLDVVVEAPDRARRLDPVEWLHLEVHQYDVRALPDRVEELEHVEGAVAAVGVADDRDVGLAVEERRQPVADDRVVVDDEDPDDPGLSCRCASPPPAPRRARPCRAPGR